MKRDYVFPLNAQRKVRKIKLVGSEHKQLLYSLVTLMNKHTNTGLKQMFEM